MKEQSNIKELGLAFDNYFLMIRKSFRWNTFYKHEHKWQKGRSKGGKTKKDINDPDAIRVAIELNKGDKPRRSVR